MPNSASNPGLPTGEAACLLPAASAPIVPTTPALALSPPVASVVVCTRDRAESLSRTLDTLAALDVSGLPAVELVVVDNGSTDGTASVLRSSAARFPFTFLVVSETKPGLSFARNAGLVAARGDLIVFTDDDCLVPTDWLHRAFEAFGGDFRQIIAGQVVLHDPSHLPISVRVESKPECLECPAQAFGFLLGANMAFGRCVINEIGVFDIRFGAGTSLRAGEDIEFAYRAYAAGVPVRYEPSFTLRHDHGRTRPDELVRLTWGYAVGTGAMVAKHFTDHPGLLKPLYWDLRSALRNAVARPSSWRNLAARVGFLVGAFRYMRLQSRQGTTS